MSDHNYKDGDIDSTPNGIIMMFKSSVAGLIKAISTANPLPVVTVSESVSGKTPTDASGTIATGGVAQTALTANSSRSRFRLQNIDATENLYFNDMGATATQNQGSFLLTPYGFYEGNSQSAISVLAATTGHKFSLTWY
jgi:hypothetical protein